LSIADGSLEVIKKGAPSVGTGPKYSHIWDYNGTSSACVQAALGYVFPNFANFTTPDLVMSGPNFGLNLGSFLYTLSGVIGATNTAVEGGIPEIAISAGYGV
jgi:5'-nucleotidase